MCKELEALETLHRSACYDICYSEHEKQSYLILKQALKRDEPMKVDLETILNLSYADFYDCPKCGKTVRDIINRRYYNYCPFCGQKLDWSEKLKKKGT